MVTTMQMGAHLSWIAGHSLSLSICSLTAISKIQVLPILVIQSCEYEHISGFHFKDKVKYVIKYLR